MMDKCDKCGMVVSYAQSATHWIMGAYSAVLCARCRNLLEDWLRALPEWSRYVEVQARKRWLAALAVAKRPECEEWLANARAEDALLTRFFKLIGEWMVERMPVPESEGT